uniref:Uncharacterized protein n=1 Tax=Arundo donax TaxID=35708 RepID=A0A0A8ZV15_ARUDO
MRTTRLNLHIY